MEFIDGEDLRSLLRRIGRLPSDKGVEISVQLCAGLAAAHEKDVVHRDLKPANVMIDGRGRVRITDFGLAAELSSPTQRDAIAGTPAYMAPEQLLEGETSVQSDIYSLGLILCELFTGKSPHGKRTLGDLRKLHAQESGLRPPSDFLKDIDPAVERALLRCLEKAPEDRPRSAAGVAVALPGGDPLAAAMAAGETPSPDVVAAAGETGGLHPAVGGVLLSAVLVSLVCVAWLFDRSSLVGILRKEIGNPDVMQEDARRILTDLGYDTSQYSAHWYWYDRGVLNRIKELNARPDRNNSVPVRPTPIVYLYTQSPQPLRPLDWTSVMAQPYDPPLTDPGMARITLNLDGHLQRLWVVPPVTEEESSETPELAWKRLFDHAGIPEDFSRADAPTIVPSHFADTRMAWAGDLNGEEVRIEAAFYAGKPVSFRVVPDWYRDPIPERTVPTWLRTTVLMLAVVAFMTATRLAWCNLRSGRSDWRGGVRLSLVTYLVLVLSNILHATSISQLFVDGPRVIRMLFAYVGTVAVVFILYGAIEPYVRRFWPQALISWSRLLAGRFADPRVGRDALIGTALGTAVSVGIHAMVVFQSTGFRTDVQLESVLGVRYVFGWLIRDVGGATVYGLALLFLLLLMRLVFRKGWLACVAFVSLPTSIAAVAGLAGVSNDSPLLLILSVLIMATFLTGAIVVLTRFGLVAMCASMYCLLCLTMMPITGDTSVWFWEKSSLLVLGAIGVLACFGFLTSLQGWSQAAKTAADL